MRFIVTGSLCAALCLVSAAARAEDQRICVEVVRRTHGDTESAAAATGPAKPGDDAGSPSTASGEPRPVPTLREAPATDRDDGAADAPPARSPARPAFALRGWPYPPEPYLKRLIEHYVTHERGFVAADTACTQHLRVELYPLDKGWTIFARYSGSQREEKADRVRYEEFSRFASRVALALLYDRPIAETVERTNVLDADSNADIEKIRGSGHFVVELGTTLRLPVSGIPTAGDDPQTPVTNKKRLLSSVDTAVGYRGTFRAWGLDVRAGIGGNASQRAGQRSNPLGGQVDPLVNVRAGLSFFWYLSPDAVNSFYVGLGTRLDVSLFRAVKPRDAAYSASDNRVIVGAGLDALGLVGMELLRTNSVRPFVEASLLIPTYVIDAENEYGSVRSWMPGLGLKFGAMF